MLLDLKRLSFKVIALQNTPKFLSFAQLPVKLVPVELNHITFLTTRISDRNEGRNAKALDRRAVDICKAGTKVVKSVSFGIHSTQLF